MKKEVTIGENIYTVEYGREIKKGEPFLYQGLKINVIVAENDINVHGNATHLAITGMSKTGAKSKSKYCHCINWHPSIKPNRGKKTTCSYCKKLRQNPFTKGTMQGI